MFFSFAMNPDREYRKDDLTQAQRGLMVTLYDDQPYEADYLPYTKEVEVMAGVLAARTGIPILLGNLCRLLVDMRKAGVLPKKPGPKNYPWKIHKRDLTDFQIELIKDLYMQHDVFSDDLPYTRELEWMALTFQARTGMVISLGNFYWLVFQIRKDGELPRKSDRNSS